MAKKKEKSETSSKYSKGDKVSFKRNALVFGSKVPISGVVEGTSLYIIENKYGWFPGQIRVKKYGLKEDTKYLFVSEKELS